jgi:type I restriction enzyme, S subunit
MASENGWATKALGECLSVIIDHRGKTPKKLGSNWITQGVPTISAESINGGRLVAEDVIRYVTHDVYKRWMSTGEGP